MLTRLRVEATRPTTPESGGAYAGEMGIGSPIQLEAVRQYTLGVLSLRLRDTAGAATAATALERMAAANSANALTRDLDRGLRARVAWASGRPDDALRLLESMESRDSQGDVAAIPFVSRANERYLRGQLLESLGRPDEALRWFASLGDGSVSEVPFQALSQVRQGAIHERLGHRSRAVDHYARALQLWRDADPLMRASVDSVRGRLASLAPRT
jgi:tetratricopeptide (TPR) repeat protein